MMNVVEREAKDSLRLENLRDRNQYLSSKEKKGRRSGREIIYTTGILLSEICKKIYWIKILKEIK